MRREAVKAIVSPMAGPDQDRLETGHYYYRARYYDPQAGRFLSEDPTDFAGGINFYWYVGNNPSIFSDPSGLKGERTPQAQKPKIPGTAVYYICCKKKSFGFCQGSGGGGANDWIGDCQREHEKQHIKDFKSGMVPDLSSFCNDPANDGKLVLVDKKDKNRVECSGYQAEQQCLKPADQQLDSIKARKKFVQQQIDNFCNPCSGKN